MLMRDLSTFRNWTIRTVGFATAILGCVPAPGQLPSADLGELIIGNTWANPARCNLGRARRVALDMLIRDYRSLRGHCIAVRGYWQGSGLFLNARDARANGSLYARQLAASRIGLYGRREIMDSNYARSRLAVTAVGNVGSCETLGDGTVMVMGYCHSLLEGPYLALADMYLEP